LNVSVAVLNSLCPKELVVTDFYRVANAINLYTLAKNNARFAGKVFSLSDYLKEMYDQKEYSTYFNGGSERLINVKRKS
jgi:hypothetical protein